MQKYSSTISNSSETFQKSIKHPARARRDCTSKGSGDLG